MTARLNPAAVAAWIAFDEGSLDAAVAKYSRDLKIPDDEASNQLTRVFKKMRTNGWIDFDEPV
ncbi:PqqD family protein [Kribbella sp. ALI-6-A]|uniref:PqqD family protein n=1 Tax=Kribbella sp. ALI-6-A TaxID=1933817 RepID=UPI00117AF53A|nr:PqqD family protein [Kribbella sp. ALI-6-A]